MSDHIPFIEKLRIQYSSRIIQLANDPRMQPFLESMLRSHIYSFELIIQIDVHCSNSVSFASGMNLPETLKSFVCNLIKLSKTDPECQEILHQLDEHDVELIILDTLDMYLVRDVQSPKIPQESDSFVKQMTNSFGFSESDLQGK